jgi:hypothetical protein
MKMRQICCKFETVLTVLYLKPTMKNEAKFCLPSPPPNIWQIEVEEGRGEGWRVLEGFMSSEFICKLHHG